MIETPRTVVLNWYGDAEEAPVPGHFLQWDSGRHQMILAVRRVKVKVTKGETVRLSCQVIDWPLNERPADAAFHECRWNPRKVARRQKARYIPPPVAR